MSESGGDSDTGETHFQHTGEPTPSRYAGQPLPEEGARMWDVSSVSIPPSFGRRCPQGGVRGAEWSKKERLKSTIYENTLSTSDAVPLPQEGRLRGAALRVDVYKGRCPKVVSSHQPLKTTHPCFQTTGFNGFRRFKGFRWRLRRILDDGIPVSSAFPSRGRCPEGADRAQAV